MDWKVYLFVRDSLSVFAADPLTTIPEMHCSDLRYPFCYETVVLRCDVDTYLITMRIM
jgi:hypothetical protein